MFCIVNYRRSIATIKIDVNDFNLQFILMVAASSVGEELFYRAAVQVCFGTPVPEFDPNCLEMFEK